MQCVRTQILDTSQEKGSNYAKGRQKCCGLTKFAVSLQCQKVNRLFRLVVIDLGF